MLVIFITITRSSIFHVLKCNLQKKYVLSVTSVVCVKQNENICHVSKLYILMMETIFVYFMGSEHMKGYLFTYLELLVLKTNTQPNHIHKFIIKQIA